MRKNKEGAGERKGENTSKQTKKMKINFETMHINLKQVITIVKSTKVKNRYDSIYQTKVVNINNLNQNCLVEIK